MTGAAPEGRPPVRAVVSDFGGVLTVPLIHAFTAYHRTSGISAEELRGAMTAATDRWGAHPLFELEKGAITEQEFQRRLEAELAGDRRLTGFRETYFEHLHANDRMVAYMRELRDRGLRMAMLTNNIREWEPHWRAKLPDIDEIFELVVDSAFVGARKPEPEIYRILLERLGDGIAAEHCLFVDDLEVNCEAARDLGMRAVRFEETGQAIAEMERELTAAES